MQEGGRDGAWRAAGVGAVCFLLGVLGTLIVKFPPVPEPKVVLCPAPPPCPDAACPPVAAAPARPARTDTVRAAQRRPEPPPPLPALVEDPDLHRDHLRAWFEQQAQRLVGCVGKNEPRRRVLLEMKIEPDGRVEGATLLGAADLSDEATACVQGRIKALRVPQVDVRGKETLVVHVSL